MAGATLLNTNLTDFSYIYNPYQELSQKIHIFNCRDFQFYDYEDQEQVEFIPGNGTLNFIGNPDNAVESEMSITIDLQEGMNCYIRGEPFFESSIETDCHFHINIALLPISGPESLGGYPEIHYEIRSVNDFELSKWQEPEVPDGKFQLQTSFSPDAFLIGTEVYTYQIERKSEDKDDDDDDDNDSYSDDDSTPSSGPLFIDPAVPKINVTVGPNPCSVKSNSV